MLTGIGLRNFKAFGDEMQEAPLSKITLIYGPNSSGKSSIVQALLMLRQSLFERFYEESVLATRGDIDLGGFQVVLHKHDTRRQIGINMAIQNLVSSSVIQMRFSDIRGSGTLSAVHHTISLINSSRSIYESHMEYQPASIESGLSKWITLSKIQDTYSDAKRYSQDVDGHFLPTPEMLNMVRFWARPMTRRIASSPEDLRRILVDRVRIPRSVEIHRLTARPFEQLDDGLDLDEEREPEWAEGLATALVQSQFTSEEEQVLISARFATGDHERHLHLVNYLGPLRSPPERSYAISIQQHISSGVTGNRGEYTANALYYKSSVREQVNDWFHKDKLDIPYKLEIQKLGGASLAGELITIALTDRRNGTRVTLADVGYGISQLLPVIVEGVASNEESIICVEELETNLHPRLQANIADLMIDTISDKNGKRKQWIVETHSELLILRLQRRIREGKIKPEDISVLYVDPNDESTEGSAIKVLRLGEDSYFKDPWPDGFFADSLNEQLLPDEGDSDVDNESNILDKLFSSE